jgi:hypothetical protein
MERTCQNDVLKALAAAPPAKHVRIKETGPERFPRRRIGEAAFVAARRMKQKESTRLKVSQPCGRARTRTAARMRHCRQEEARRKSAHQPPKDSQIMNRLALTEFSCHSGCRAEQARQKRDPMSQGSATPESQSALHSTCRRADSPECAYVERKVALLVEWRGLRKQRAPILGLEAGRVPPGTWFE